MMDWGLQRSNRSATDSTGLGLTHPPQANNLDLPERAEDAWLAVTANRSAANIGPQRS